MSPPRGLIALSAFFASGAAIAGVTCVALLTPGATFLPIFGAAAGLGAATLGALTVLTGVVLSRRPERDD